jgi:hypothetical protein
MKNTDLTEYLIIIVIFAIWYLYDFFYYYFKTKYYEQKFKNYKSKFTQEEWEDIEEMINKPKWLFWK